MYHEANVQNASFPVDIVIFTFCIWRVQQWMLKCSIWNETPETIKMSAVDEKKKKTQQLNFLGSDNIGPFIIAKRT